MKAVPPGTAVRGTSERMFGAGLFVEATPVPDIGTTSGLSFAGYFTSNSGLVMSCSNVPCTGPSNVGVNVTCTVQVPCGARDDGQLLVWAKSAQS